MVFNMSFLCLQSPCKDVCRVHQLILMHIAFRPNAFICKDTPAYMYIYRDIIQVIHLHNFAYTLKFTLAESPRDSTCEATHPSVGHGVDGAAWFPANISSGTLQCLRFELTEPDQSKHRALEHLTASDCI